MGKPKLKLIQNETPQPLKLKGRGWQGEDTIFFHRSQVRLGTVFINVGRTMHNTLWEVVAFKTYEGKKRPSLIHLKDLVVLKRAADGFTRECCFAQLSYSAIWRLAGE